MDNIIKENQVGLSKALGFDKIQSLFPGLKVTDWSYLEDSLKYDREINIEKVLVRVCVYNILNNNYEDYFVPDYNLDTKTVYMDNWDYYDPSENEELARLMSNYGWSVVIKE